MRTPFSEDQHMKTQICLVSQQAAANLLPALDPALKPDKVILVVSARMQQQAAQLSRVFRESAITVEQLSLGDEQDFHLTEEELVDLAARIDGEDVALNITGGTKLMSVAAQSVAQTSGWRMFYVDADSDQVIWLGRDAPAPRALDQQLRLRHYLRSYGFKMLQEPCRTQATAEQQRLTQTLVLQIGSLENAIGTLNALAQDAENRRRLGSPLSDWQRDSRSLDVLLRHFENAGTLTLQGDKVVFSSEAARDFVKGGWLELHAIQAVHQITGSLGIRDKAVNLTVEDESSHARSELDIAFMARNRLFIIECKTARMDKPHGPADKIPKVNDILFKLAENCRRIGGLGTRGMLLSYRKLRDPELQLARSLSIEVVAGSEVTRLAERLKHWVDPQG
ncbi:DUF1887 family protein [Burkholderiales bacterium]